MPSGGNQKIAAIVNQADESLHFTPGQKEQFESIVTERTQAILALRADSTLPAADGRKRERMILDAANNQIRAFLKPDQAKVFEEMVTRQMARWEAQNALGDTAAMANGKPGESKAAGSPLADEDERKRDLLPVGAPAPDYSFLNERGETVRLSDFKGRTVVLDFWATWCMPCIASMPHNEAVTRRAKTPGIVFLAVCAGDTRAHFDAWVKRNAQKYPDLVFVSDPRDDFDPKNHDRISGAVRPADYEQRLTRKYGVRDFPTQFVINGQGRITAVIVGGYTDGDTQLEDGLAKAGVKFD